MKIPHIVLLATFLTAAAHAAHSAPVQTTDYPAVKLRNYGTLAGTLATQGRESTLKIACDDAAKAAMLQAKYISDLQTLPGVKTVTTPVPACLAPSQGLLAAGRNGATVYLFAAPTPKALAKLIAAAGDGTLTFKSDAKVPMSLDRFDRYGFQSYYHPYQVPQARTPSSKVVTNQVDDFKFAQQNGHIGLVLAHVPDPAQTAEGIYTGNSADWVLNMARDYQLPLAFNLDIYNTMAVINRYPEQIMQFQPGFLGGEYGSMAFAENVLSWNAFEAKDVALGGMINTLRPLAGNPNLTDWLEGHSEMHHGLADLMVEYGPVADQGYRLFLKEKYGTPAAVSQRWYGDATTIKTWDEVHVPEFYSFLGFGPGAIDLTGTWSISYSAPFDASSAAPGLDDSTWAKTPAPGHAIARLFPKKPAVYRRHLTIDSAWLQKNPRVWIYVWDFNDTRNGATDPLAKVNVFVNGKLIPETPYDYSDQAHWAVLDVTGALTAGENVITIDLPRGIFNGRVYLSGHALIKYPNLGTHMNAQWADFAIWNMWSRENAVYRGCEAIRVADPNSGIKLAAPGPYIDGIDKSARDFGGDLHDTGSMAGFWNEGLSALMRGARLPMSAEPGGPAPDPQSLQLFFGRWLTEAVNQIDYFQEMGDIQWYPDIRKCFEEYRNVFTAIGKYHAPQAQVAELDSGRNSYLINFPWTTENRPESNPDDLGSGYWQWNVRSVLRNIYESDALTESSFDSGDAARYRVIIDSNTTIMDEKQVADIEKYVRGGGTFVTFVQTGRHTPEQKDAWPIERLTGYHVTRLNQPNPWRTGMLSWAKGENIFTGNWADGAKADGLSLKKIAPEAEDLACWKDDGSVAIGMRRLGDGCIIEVGCRFTSGGLPQRLNYDLWDYYNKFHTLAQWGFPPDDSHGLMTPDLLATRALFSQIVQWRGVTPMPVRVEPENDPQTEHLIFRHDISNSGLYDVWTVWNDSTTDPLSASLVLTGGLQPAWRINLKDGSRTPLTDNRLAIKLAPCEVEIYLTPRNEIAAAPTEWFTLQRNWWHGAKSPGKPFPTQPPKLTVDLTNGWLFQPLDPKADATPLAAPGYDDSHWKLTNLGIFSLPDYPDAKHGIFRKRITIPAAWNHGRVLLSIQFWNGETFLDTGRVYIDGKEILHSANGLSDNDLGGVLAAGTTHLLAVEVSGGKHVLVGERGPIWLSYHPEPQSRVDLAGDWEVSKDLLHYTPAHLPGIFDGTTIRRTFTMSAPATPTNIVVHVGGNGNFERGLIINGRYVAGFHHWLNPEENLNITPWVKFNQPNELILIGAGYKGGGKVDQVCLELHDKDSYP